MYSESDSIKNVLNVELSMSIVGKMIIIITVLLKRAYKVN